MYTQPSGHHEKLHPNGNTRHSSLRRLTEGDHLLRNIRTPQIIHGPSLSTESTTSLDENQKKKKLFTNLDHLLLYLVNGLLWKTNNESGTPRSQSGWKTSLAKKDDKEDQCASRVVDSSNTNQWGKKEANDESGTPRSQSGWKTSWDKKDDKEDQCAF
ncbi:hypothetical protein Tco_0165138 [Tanacetum coccineum]